VGGHLRLVCVAWTRDACASRTAGVGFTWARFWKCDFRFHAQAGSMGAIPAIPGVFSRPRRRSPSHTERRIRTAPQRRVWDVRD
jgi:hypothetical protein